MKKNQYKYYIIKDKSLIIEVLSGSFDFVEYLNLKQLQIEDADYNPNFNIIIDIRNIEESNISEKTIKEYADNIKPVQLFNTKIKVAIITNSPSQVVGALLYKLFENKSIEYKVFSTIEYTLNWLGIIDLNHKLL